MAEPRSCQLIVRPVLWRRSCEGGCDWSSRRNEPFAPEICEPAAGNLRLWDFGKVACTVRAPLLTTPISARRFFAHASSFEAGSAGISAPKLTVWMLCPSAPLAMSASRTDCARRSPRTAIVLSAVPRSSRIRDDDLTAALLQKTGDLLNLAVL